MAYSVDHNNTLPGTRVSDFNKLASRENFMYGGWSGHLMPYIDRDMTETKWSKGFKLMYDGKWHHDLGGDPKLKENYGIMTDAVEGKGVFRMMYCPEVINNIVDPGLKYIAASKGTLVEVPKMYFLTNQYVGYGYAFLKKGYSGSAGLPTTYLANDDLMHPSDPKKISELNNFGKKLMITEGGNTTSDHLAGSLISARNNMHYQDFGFRMIHTKQASYLNMMLTFPHDEEGEYWRSEHGIYALNRPNANKFNEMCNGTAYVAPNRDYYGMLNDVAKGAEEAFWMEFVTHENPYTSTKYQDLMKQVLGWNWKGSFDYISDEDLYIPSTGKSNVLYGDGRVSTEHAAWLFVNRGDLLWSSVSAE